MEPRSQSFAAPLSDANASEPRKKRPRSDTQSQPQDGPPQRDEEFWYEDGTIVLIAGNVEFRVYRGTLAKHSAIFRGMLSIPQPPAGSDNRDCGPVDCPVIQLSDSPEDLRHVLRVFAFGETLTPRGISSPSIHVVSAWIRLGHKYQIESLVEDGIAYLRTHYPDGPLWIKNCKQGPISTTVPRKALAGIHAIAVVNLARLTDKEGLLPLALLECCKLGAEIMYGYEREDGSREVLGIEDIGRCILAKGLLMRDTAAAFVEIAQDLLPSRSCEQETSCKKTMQLTRNFQISEGMLQTLDLDTLLLKDVCERRLEVSSLCGWCRAEVEGKLRMARRKFWYLLPRRLNIETPNDWCVGFEMDESDDD